MSTNIVHFLKISGVAAGQVRERCETLLARATFDEDSRLRLPDWSDEDVAQIDALGRALIFQARELPVVHYTTHLDGWTMCNGMLRMIPWPDGRERVLAASNIAIAFYRNEDFERLRYVLRRRATRRARRRHEPNYYEAHLSAAIDDCRWLTGDAIALAIVECLGGSREDFELEAALSMPLNL